jgi:hypothetical protein
MDVDPNFCIANAYVNRQIPQLPNELTNLIFDKLEIGDRFTFARTHQNACLHWHRILDFKVIELGFEEVVKGDTAVFFKDLCIELLQLHKELRDSENSEKFELDFTPKSDLKICFDLEGVTTFSTFETSLKKVISSPLFMYIFLSRQDSFKKFQKVVDVTARFFCRSNDQSLFKKIEDVVVREKTRGVEAHFNMVKESVDFDFDLFLNIACGSGKKDFVEILLNFKIELDGFLPHINESTAYPEIIKLLIDHKADVNLGALNAACRKGHVATVKILLAANANPNLIIEKKTTSFDIQDMMDGKKDLDNNGKFPAINESTAYPEIVKLLIDHEADVNLGALHIACNEGHLEAAEMLIAAGADLGLKDAFDKTPLDYAIKKNNLAMIALLQKEIEKKKLEG